MFNRLTHQALQWACSRADKQFRQQHQHLEVVQRRKLQHILAQVAQAQARPRLSQQTWEQFSIHQPTTRYADWQSTIHQQRQGQTLLTTSPLVRYQPTSGSSEKLKFIPYTKAFLQELDAAIAPWLASMYRHYPQINGGVHYWSVSWLPQSQYSELQANLNDDSELLGSVKRVLAGQSQAVPADVALAASAEDALFATLCYLVAQPNLRMLSVWSPTFALQLLDALPVWADEICTVLKTGKWLKRSHALAKMRAPYAPKRAQALAHVLSLHASVQASELWPQLALVSAWDTAEAAPWAKQLKACFPHAAFEGKGLWATEGVVTIPVDGQYPLAYRSHVYEFEDLSNGGILAPWELKEGDIVSPIITSGNGLLRYQLDDRIVVNGFWGEIPCFSFLGRRFGVDLVGEKLSPDVARQVLAKVGQKFGVHPVSLMAVTGENKQRPRYVALFSQPQKVTPYHVCYDIAAMIEHELCQHFHYELARDLRQLEPALAVVAEDAWQIYQQIAIASGMIEGNIKPEPVRRMPRAAVQQVLAVLPLSGVDNHWVGKAS
ncbi:GH3 family domain-containing protein [Agitococcus lubricus]|uniref:GH3 auxin-responsive promoter n=1 Tax=Agitococcus lubricus TaxID=1077255 RepID=A0A2T5J0U7_9GAMM|nr:GH3 auxin-responsive promoter family protein [Agitococcus lubricus]PTQ90011.1 GH3 auxin-responsive promoter [Agitococcus lubricus]